MKLEPLANRVVMEEIDAAAQTHGSILIPDVARKNKGIAYGRVVAVGPGRHTSDGKLIPCSVKEGDIVMFPRQAPAILPLTDDHGAEKDFLLCPDNDIIGRVHGLEQRTRLTGLDGALLKMEPVSLARPDSAYKNIAEIDEAVADLRQSGAPPEFIAELEADYQDEED